MEWYCLFICWATVETLSGDGDKPGQSKPFTLNGFEKLSGEIPTTADASLTDFNHGKLWGLNADETGAGHHDMT